MGELSDDGAENRFNGKTAVLIKAAVFTYKQCINQCRRYLLEFNNLPFFVGREFGNQVSSYIKYPGW